jgi:molybdopterin-guanine dinucleotide biosynthesis protein A
MTYLEHAVRRLRPVCRSVCLAGETRNTPRRTVASGIVTVPDPVPGLGPAAGVAAALEHARAEALAGCLVTPVDTPQLNTHDLRALIDRWLPRADTVVCAVGGRTRRLQPLIAIYPTGVCGAIRELLTSSDRSLRRWLEGHPHQEVTLDESSLININRPEDLTGGR